MWCTHCRQCSGSFMSPSDWTVRLANLTTSSPVFWLHPLTTRYALADVLSFLGRDGKTDGARIGLCVSGGTDRQNRSRSYWRVRPRIVVLLLVTTSSWTCALKFQFAEQRQWVQRSLQSKPQSLPAVYSALTSFTYTELLFTAVI